MIRDSLNKLIRKSQYGVWSYQNVGWMRDIVFDQYGHDKPMVTFPRYTVISRPKNHLFFKRINLTCLTRKAMVRWCYCVPICLSLLLTGCANMDMNKQDIGVITGGAIGGLAGGYFGQGSGKALAVVGGAIAGATIGGLMGHHMDRLDQEKLQLALNQTPTKKTLSWKNPDTGHRYSVTLTKTYYQSNHQPCREYYLNAHIGGETKQVYGVACRQYNGVWKIKR